MASEQTFTLRLEASGEVTRARAEADAEPAEALVDEPGEESA
ncbi:hypothetical protein ACIP4S_13050 [Streptomyces chartreusis]